MKCFICGKRAIFSFSPDLDIEGLGACKRHEERVRMGYVVIHYDKKLGEELLGVKKKRVA